MSDRDVVVCDGEVGRGAVDAAVVIVECASDLQMMVGEGGRGGDGVAYVDLFGGGVCGRDDTVDEFLECALFILIV